jgi:hypothetical protein
MSETFGSSDIHSPLKALGLVENEKLVLSSYNSEIPLKPLNYTYSTKAARPTVAMI